MIKFVIEKSKASETKFGRSRFLPMFFKLFNENIFKNNYIQSHSKTFSLYSYSSFNGITTYKCKLDLKAYNTYI